MQNIFEAMDNMKSLAKDFEIVGNDAKINITKKFLKELKSRQESLKLDYDDCRRACSLVKHNDLDAALKLIWKNKVSVNSHKEEDGFVSVKEYNIQGYGKFTERINRNMGGYIYSLDAEYNGVDDASAALSHIVHISIKPTAGDVDALEDRAMRDSFLNLPAARIYNFLFVCYDDYDIASALNRFHVKLKNKLKKA